MVQRAADKRAGLTRWQRMAQRRLLKTARKRPGEALEPEDWAAFFAFTASPGSRAWQWVMRSLPSSPHCGMCGAPFGGLGSRLVSPLGYFPSRKNPNICATCVELAPPGGMTTQAGVLFADIRGFTARAAEAGPVETSRLLRRFYACAEDVLLPGALIDKLIGDAVMALYLPIYNLAGDPASRSRGEPRDVAMVMIRHARQLLARIGYGTPDGPFAEIGIGLDFGELFIGNIGDGAVSDFTAIGDVVNTASRLQGAAGGGEILASERLAAELAEPPGERIEVQVKGKPAPVAAYRIRANGR